MDAYLSPRPFVKCEIQTAFPGIELALLIPFPMMINITLNMPLPMETLFINGETFCYRFYTY